MGVNTEPTPFLPVSPPETQVGETNRHNQLAASRLVQFLEEHLESLQEQVSAMVSRSNWGATPIDEMEVFSKTIAEVWRKVDQFDPQQPPRAWFLAFAANIIKQQHTQLGIRQRHEVRVDYLGVSFDKSTLEPLEIFERLAQQNPRSLEDAVSRQDSLNQAFASLSDDDRQIIWLAHIYEMRSPEIAQKLNIRPGTARTRLARAMERFRVAYFGLGGSEQ